MSENAPTRSLDDIDLAALRVSIVITAQVFHFIYAKWWQADSLMDHVMWHGKKMSACLRDEHEPLNTHATKLRWDKHAWPGVRTALSLNHNLRYFLFSSCNKAFVMLIRQLALSHDTVGRKCFHIVLKPRFNPLSSIGLAFFPPLFKP